VVNRDRALPDVLHRTLSLAGDEVRVTETGARARSEVNGSLPNTVVLNAGLGFARHKVQVSEKFVELSRAKNQLLEPLMLNPCRAVSHTAGKHTSCFDKKRRCNSGFPFCSGLWVMICLRMHGSCGRDRF
jgi:hypothetical protein